MSCEKCTTLAAERARLSDAMAEDPENYEVEQEFRSLPRAFDCSNCGAHLETYRGGDVDCDRCSASFNGFGQRLRNDWHSNTAWRDDSVDDLEGFERSQLAREQRG